VDFDHQYLLGSTLVEIAREKAGIIKPGVPVIAGPNPVEVLDVVRAAATSRRAPLVLADEGVEIAASFREGRLTLAVETRRARYGPVPLGLRGRHQLGNALTAIALAEAIDRTSALAIPVSAIESGLRDVEWPGRLQLASWRGTPVLIDAAHNPSGARALAAYVAEVHGKLPFVFGAMRDKDIAGILEPLAAVMTSLTLTMPSTPRAASLDELEDAARRAAPAVPVTRIAAPVEALDHAARAGTTVAVAGSLYLAGDILAALS
jgi:dihydrofolate synthase/folylpolyglutamate synthase